MPLTQPPPRSRALGVGKVGNHSRASEAAMQNSPPSSKPSRSVLMMSGASRSTQGPFDFVPRQQESGSKSRAPLRTMTLQQRLLEEERRLAAQTPPQHEQCPCPCTRRAVEEEEGGEGPLERKMRLGQLLDDDEVEELKKRAMAEEVATDLDLAAEAVVTAPASPCRLAPAPGSSPASSPAFGRAPPPHLPPRPAPQRDLQLFRENLRTDMSSLRARHVRQPTRMEPRPPPPPPKAPPAPAYRAAPSHRAAPMLSGATKAQPETPPSSPPVRATSPTDIYAEPWKTSLGATAEPTSRVRLNSARGAAEPELARKLFCLPPPYIAA